MNPYAVIVFLVVLILTNAGSFLGGRSYEAGEQAKKLYDQALAYAGEIVKARDEKDEAERAHTQRLADISTHHQKEIRDAKVRRDRDVDDARAGVLRLWFGTGTGAALGVGTAATLGSATGRCNDRAAGELRSEAGGDIRGVALPDEISARLYSLAHDANDVARQLAACQRVVIEDRRLCNGGEGK